MSWEFLRDLGLGIFAAGVLAGFVLSRIFHRYVGPANAAVMATTGDALMLAGACLAVTAMIIGHFVPGENP